MAAKAESGAVYNVVYEDIEPFFEWHAEDGFHVLVVMLPGFRRDQLKVQVTSTPILNISAQRQIGGNRWRRVYKEFSLPSDSDPNDITAKFESGTLRIKCPRLVTPPSKSPERDADDSDKNGAKLEDEQEQPKPKIDDDDQVISGKSQKVQEPGGRDDDDLTKEKGKADDDQEKPKSADHQDSGKTNQKEKEPAEAPPKSDDFAKEKGKIDNGVDEKNSVHHQEKAKSSADEVSGKTPEAKQKKEKESLAAAAESEADRDGKQRSKNVSRLKTRLLDFNLSLRPSSRAYEQEDYSYEYKEALSDMVARLKKMKNLMNLMVVTLLVVACVFYLKNAFKPSLEGSEEPEL